MFEVYIAVTLVVIIIIEAVWIKMRAQKELYESLPPGSMGWPIIGESLEFAKKKIGFFVERHRQYGRVFKTHMLGKPVIRVYGADNLRKIILGENKIVQSFYPTSVRKLIGGQSISMCHGDVHKIKKRQLMKYLSPEFINNHIPVFVDTISKRLKQWCEQPQVDLFPECKKLFVELAAKYLVKLDITDADILEIMKQHEIFSTNLFCLPFYIPGFGFYKAMKAKQRMREIFVKCLNQNRDPNGSLCSVLEEYHTAGSRDLDIQKDQLFLDAIIELLFFGAETITSAGFSIIYNLTKNDEIFDKLKDTINNNDNDVYSRQDLQQNNYADLIIKEALRVFPPVGGAYRKVIKSFELDGYTVPEGWSICFSIRDTHHNDNSIENPLSFNPDQWLQQGFEKERFSFLPFGGGSRICPGQTYAKTLLKIFTIELGKLCKTNLINDSEIDFWPLPKPKTHVTISASLNGEKVESDGNVRRCPVRHLGII